MFEPSRLVCRDSRVISLYGPVLLLIDLKLETLSPLRVSRSYSLVVSPLACDVVLLVMLWLLLPKAPFSSKEPSFAPVRSCFFPDDSCLNSPSAGTLSPIVHVSLRKTRTSPRRSWLLALASSLARLPHACATTST